MRLFGNRRGREGLDRLFVEVDNEVAMKWVTFLYPSIRRFKITTFFLMADTLFERHASSGCKTSPISMASLPLLGPEPSWMSDMDPCRWLLITESESVACSPPGRLCGGMASLVSTVGTLVCHALRVFMRVVERTLFTTRWSSSRQACNKSGSS